MPMTDSMRMKRIGAAPSASGRLLGGKPDEARELARDRQQRMHGAGVALAPQLEADGDAAVLDEREGVRRIDRDRREDRQVAGEELLLEPFALGERQLLGFDDEDARRRPSRP